MSLAILASPLVVFAWLGSGPKEAGMRDVAECPAQPKPPAGDYLITDFSDRVAPFGVKSDRGLDYLVKLERTDERTARLLFYLIGGQQFETRVPLGTYRLTYAAGNTWCGLPLLFGNKQVERGRVFLTFSQSSDHFDGHTVTLYTVPHGNFETEVIPREQF